MNFHVPYAAHADEAEMVWSEVRADLLELGLPTTRRRIVALSLHPDIEDLVAVGEDTPDGELVMVILEASNLDIFYVCTLGHGLLTGPPYPLKLGKHGRVFDFHEEVVWG